MKVNYKLIIYLIKKTIFIYKGAKYKTKWNYL